MNEPEHFDDLFDQPEILSGGGENGGGGGSNVMDKDSFHKVFVGGFNVAHIVTKLNSLKVSAEDGTARAASDAIYETINDIPMLRFLLEPQGKWAGRVMCIGMFVVPMAISVQAEIGARQNAAGAAPGQSTGGALVVPDFDMSGRKKP